MSQKLLLLGVLSLLVMVTHAQPSAEETALRNAILSSGPSTYTLTKNIILTQDLPPLADQKVLTVQSASKSGAPFKIDGQKKYKIFRCDQGVIVKLTLNNIVLTRSPIAVDLFGTEPAGNPPYTFIELRASKVKFISNAVALQLYVVNALIDKSEFTSQSQVAIQISSEEGLGDEVTITSTKFTKNAGAIRVNKYSSIAVDRSTFDQNKADTGGAIYVDRGFAKITKSTFSSNVAVTTGGAIYLTDAGFTGISLVFKNNVANTQGGGAVSLRGFTSIGDGSVASFQSSSFTGNKALKTPGGAFLLNDNNRIVFCKSTFSGNLGKSVSGPSDGYVLGPNNVLTVTSGSAMPKVTVAADAQLSAGTDVCS
eukprot:TRINITY_DN20219_c0_g1_i1.p1 TRINITY_DN20219_c0_g1~~TRINITY_DN20219_c0_g1_i1.p1  ORF type:complete len:368 (+),score=69.51 TRINITY_DN20219_c0_g1_i1:110-1213(+)